jgi:hypothetical protein
MLQALGIRVAFELYSAPASSLMLAYGKSQYAAAGNTVRMLLMVSGVWLAFVYFGTAEAVFALLIAQAVSYVPLIIGISRLVPETGAAEVRWYTAFLLALCAFATLRSFILY